MMSQIMRLVVLLIVIMLKKKDHLALTMELLGMMPRKVALGGHYSRELFNRYGDLRRIRRLKFWRLNKVIREKYEFSEQDANDQADFLVQILNFVPEKRPTAAQFLNHPWISAGTKRLTPSLSQLHSMGNNCAEKKREKDEREAMEDGVGNMAIDGAPKPVKYSQPTGLLLSNSLFKCLGE
ncbi:SRSF protein kinase 1-like isoform X1 [Olea europaea var. sylvestris]|uniref:SRSF protein kinase 1-like isoform X1 n=1 Tax=Olea europaea var. sylvestris TaxID=158386 RepID=UPI000C1D15AC|nr:SRSF protein kinase 1-like isoform X1 [Olea europaea var. sylvestris]